MAPQEQMESSSFADSVSSELEAAEEEKENKDYKEFKQLRQGRRISDLFDPDFLTFCHFLRKEVHKNLSLKDFRAINRIEVLKDFLYFSLLPIAYLLLLHFAQKWELLWGPALFFCALLVCRRESMVHARMHYISNCTDWPWLDKLIDFSMMFLTGFSKEAFYRRHLDEHLSYVANHARVFGQDWLPFDDLPALWWLQPWKMILLLVNQDRIKRENFNFYQIAWETISLHLYLGLLMFEFLYWNTHFILVYHTIPMLIINGARLMTGIFTHSGLDARNSFNSCGLFDHRVCPGLFRVTLTLINFLSNTGVSVHPIHHGYSQCPVPVLHARVWELNEYVLTHYKNVRYNRLLSHEVHASILERLPDPRWYDYIFQFFFAWAVLSFTTLVILGLPFPPVIFELGMVDYRALLFSDKAERCANTVALWDSLKLIERAQQLPVQHGYLKFSLRSYAQCKKYLEAHPFPIPKRLFGPVHVYAHNVWPYVVSKKEN